MSEESWQTGSSRDQTSEKHYVMLADRDIPKTLKSVRRREKPANREKPQQDPDDPNARITLLLTGNVLQKREDSKKVCLLLGNCVVCKCHITEDLYIVTDRSGSWLVRRKENGKKRMIFNRASSVTWSHEPRIFASKGLGT